MRIFYRGQGVRHSKGQSSVLGTLKKASVGVIYRFVWGGGELINLLVGWFPNEVLTRVTSFCNTHISRLKR